MPDALPARSRLPRKRSSTVFGTQGLRRLTARPSIVRNDLHDYTAEAVDPTAGSLNRPPVRSPRREWDTGRPRAHAVSVAGEHFRYEPTWKPFAEHTRRVAIDLSGFRQSERANLLMSPRRWPAASLFAAALYSNTKRKSQSSINGGFEASPGDVLSVYAPSREATPTYKSLFLLCITTSGRRQRQTHTRNQLGSRQCPLKPTASWNT
jgi:hypothetical protein